MAQIIKISRLRITNLSFSLYLDRISVLFCVVTTVLTQFPLTLQYFFVLLNAFRYFNFTVTKRLQFALMYYAEAKNSLKRIEDFLLCEYQPQKFSNLIVNNTLSTSRQAICIEHIDTTSEKNLILKDVTFKVFPGELVGIAGTAGSGKSTLLQVILKEVEPTQGSVVVEGTLSYSAQEAWIFSASVRQNILFGQEMDQDKYQKVIGVCALEDDLSLFPHGDQTLVGERGVMLSGGQKARISLARAVYRDADIYLLDDPLSAVDAHVAEHIFNECILNYLKSKCVVLVTHQIKYLKKVNKMFLIEHGKLTAGEAIDKVNKVANDNKIGSIALKRFGAVSEAKELQSREATSQNMYKQYCCGGHWSMSLFICIMCGFVQLVSNSTDFFVAFWIGLTDTPNNSGSELTKVLSPQTFLYLYSTLTILLVVSIHLLAFFYIKYCGAISKKVHDALLHTVLDVPIKFFNDHSSGRILNRFSKNLGCIDRIIPVMLFELITNIFYVIGIFVVISILNYWLILLAVGLVLFFYLLAHLFKPINKNLRRTEGVGKFSHL
jgi:ATP-binding cassette subfamily C (CFTR/MRP) protein 4